MPEVAKNILGICCTGHGASLCLVSPVCGVRAMSLERYTGQKHAILLSRNEARDILGRTNPTDAMIFGTFLVGHGKIPPIYIIEDTFPGFLQALFGGLDLTPDHVDMVITSDCFFAVNRHRMGHELDRFFPNAQVVFDPEHHEIHRYQAYFASPFDHAAVLTVDAAGEPLPRLGNKKLAMTMAEAKGNEFAVLGEHFYPMQSPGSLYSAISQYIGFFQGQEGKTMGLAPYGTDRVYKKLAPLLSLHDNGSFHFPDRHRIFSELKAFSPPRKHHNQPIRQVHADMAYAADALLLDILENAVSFLEKATKAPNLCMAGGVALNSVANEKLLRNSRFSHLYVTPNAGDTGQALGLALYGARVLENTPSNGGVPHDYLGPVYADEQIRQAIEAAGFSTSQTDSNPDEIAKLLADELIVGWFSGGSEYGPRALGHRSILADPRPAHMKDWVNERVKFREAYRPFAPAVLEEKAHEWFDITQPSPFMLRVLPVKKEKQSQLAAVTHVDGSARVQTVSQKTSPRFHALLRAFENHTQVPVLLNTSFNVAGKPIVETPQDAIACFVSTEIDVLVLGDYLLQKPEAKKQQASRRSMEQMLQSAFAPRRGKKPVSLCIGP